MRDQATLDRLQGVIRELQLDDELVDHRYTRRSRCAASARVWRRGSCFSTSPICRRRSPRSARRGRSAAPIWSWWRSAPSTMSRSTATCWRPAPTITWSSRRAAMRWPRSWKIKPAAPAAAGDGGLGQVIVFVGSRGGVGATTAAVGCAWLLAEDRAESDRPARSRPAFRHGCAQARYRSRQRVVRSAGAALAHRQPVHRSGDGQGHRKSARPGGRGVGGAASDDRRRRHRHAALRAAPQIFAGRGRSAARRHPGAAGRARRGGPCRRDLRAQPRRAARHDPAANPDARAGAAGPPLAGRGRRQREPRADRQGRI